MRSWGTRWDGNIGIHLMKAFHQSRFPQVACGSCGLEMTGDWRWVEMARGHDWNAFSAQKALLSGNHKSRNKNTRACPKENLRVRSDCATLNKTPIPSIPKCHTTCSKAKSWHRWQIGETENQLFQDSLVLPKIFMVLVYSLQKRLYRKCSERSISAGRCILFI